MKCSFIDCSHDVGPHGAKGLCPGHYQQMKRGEDLAPLKPRNVCVPWLLDHVDYEGDECLTWPFSPAANKHGQVKYRGKMYPANRLMCIFAHGQPPTPKHEAAHSCGNGHLACVNPKHLRWATDKENKADMLLHGTRVRGERQGSAKLTTADVLAIRSLAGSASHSVLARQFDVRASTVSKIVRRERWGHI